MKYIYYHNSYKIQCVRLSTLFCVFLEGNLQVNRYLKKSYGDIRSYIIVTIENDNEKKNSMVLLITHYCVFAIVTDDFLNRFNKLLVVFVN